MTQLLTTKARWIALALGSAGVVIELTALALLSQTVNVADSAAGNLDIASCASGPIYEFAPVLIRMPMELSL